LHISKSSSSILSVEDITQKHGIGNKENAINDKVCDKHFPDFPPFQIYKYLNHWMTIGKNCMLNNYQCLSFAYCIT